jgi:hypothetical protein
MFDASSRQTCKVRSSLTNTPLHALTTLNDVTWVDASRVLAEKVLTSAATDDNRLTLLYRKILMREPRSAERTILLTMLAEQRTLAKKNPAEAAKTLQLGKAPRNTQLDPAEHAAWTAVTLALFNLDEALTRQ